MRKFLKKIAIYGFLSLVSFNLVAWASLYILGRSQFYKPQFISNGLKSRNYDYVVLGSSTGLTTLDTRQIDSITGLRGVNLSMDDTAAPSHYLMLQHFLEEGHSTQTLVLSVLPWDAQVTDPKIGKNDYRFLTYGDRDYVQAHFQALEDGYFRPLTLSRYLPIIGVATYNTEVFFPSLIAAAKPMYHNRFDDYGNYSYPESGGVTLTQKTTSPVHMRNPYLKKIEAVCKARGIRLIYYLSPNASTRYATGNSHEFINHSDLLDDGNRFYDGIHVNSRGRKVCSEAVAELLKTK